VIHVYPFGAITVGEQGQQMADLEDMARFVKGFSDDGRGVQSEEMMKEAMLRAKALGKIIVAHCELNDLLFGGGSSSKPVTTVPSGSNNNSDKDEESFIPDTGATLGAAAAAVTVLGGSGGLALFLRKRNNDGE
jgi:dihydroorotase-like cyclic amidohydrolase